jgi:hypothetical protein
VADRGNRMRANRETTSLVIRSVAMYDCGLPPGLANGFSPWEAASSRRRTGSRLHRPCSEPGNRKIIGESPWSRVPSGGGPARLRSPASSFDGTTIAFERAVTGLPKPTRTAYPGAPPVAGSPFRHGPAALPDGAPKRLGADDGALRAVGSAWAP